jgi:predicted DNA-binding transcriptional regulator AlpA
MSPVSEPYYAEVGGIVVERRFYRLIEVATVLHISRQHAYRMASAGLIETKTLGAALRVSPAEVARLLREGVPASNEGSAHD